MKIFTLCIIIFSQGAWAGWAPNEEAGIILDFANADIEVKEDGNFTQIEERQFTAKNETGRNSLAMESIKFIPDIARVEILKAVTINDGVETPIDLKTVQERAAAGPKEGLTGVQELVIPFTNL